MRREDTKDSEKRGDKVSQANNDHLVYLMVFSLPSTLILLTSVILHAFPFYSLQIY